MVAAGYFPTYSLGAMYATQIYAAAKAEIPGLEDKIKAGDFKPLKVPFSACVLFSLGEGGGSRGRGREAVQGRVRLGVADRGGTGGVG